MRTFTGRAMRSQGRATGMLMCAALLSGCAATGLSTAVGPSRSAILSPKAGDRIPNLRVVPVTNTIANMLALQPLGGSFADTIGDAQPIGTVVGVGDVLEVTIFEAPPAVLFGGGQYETRIGAPTATSRPGTLPEAVVGPSGTIGIPFAGQVPAAGRTLRQIEQSIVGRLHGKANQPQAIVRIARNTTANVSVVGEVGRADRVPLTPRGERLLDVISAVGGPRNPVDRTTIQLTRGDRTVLMPMQAVVQDARQNVVLRRDDIVTVLFQTNTFTVLGAANKNEEVRFETTGITLAQALGRIGGLQDMRADPKGVFLFRWETPERVRALTGDQTVPLGAPVPVVYQVDLKRPETLFAAQAFAMRDRDVIFITNSPSADFQRFVNTLASSVLPGLSVLNTARAQ